MAILDLLKQEFLIDSHNNINKLIGVILAPLYTNKQSSMISQKSCNCKLAIFYFNFLDEDLQVW
jgi:hypothetical protein